MAKVLVLYYSSYGHVEAMAGAVAEGARAAGAAVAIKRVPELVPAEVAAKSGFKTQQAAPVASVECHGLRSSRRTSNRCDFNRPWPGSEMIASCT